MVRFRSREVYASYCELSYKPDNALNDKTKETYGKLEYPEAELVFGFVFPVGTDYSGVLLTLENYIKRFNYKPNVIRLSDFISKIQTRVTTGTKLDNTTEATRIDTHMTAGNKLCELAEDDSFLVSAAVAEISRLRRLRDSSEGTEPLPKNYSYLDVAQTSQRS